MTESEMLAEMTRLLTPPQSDPGFTAGELAAQADIKTATMRSRLEEAVRRGELLRGWRYPVRGKRCVVYRPA